MRRTVVLAAAFLAVTVPLTTTLAASSAAANPEPALRAAGKGTPRLSLGDGAALSVRFAGATDALAAIKAGRARPTGLVEVDLDRDGRAERVASWSDGARGTLAIVRSDGRPAELLATGGPADLMVTGDFDADGLADVLVAAAGGDVVELLAGDGRGGLGLARTFRVPGAVTALAAGEIGPKDGVTDLAAGLIDADGPAVAVFSGLRGQPARRIAMQGEVRALAIGAFDADGLYDIAVAEGSDLTLVSSGLARGASVRLGVPTLALAAGRFGAGINPQLAALGADGTVRIIATDAGPAVVREVAIGAASGPGARLAAGRFATGEAEALAIAGDDGVRMLIDTDVFVLQTAGRAGAALAVQAGDDGLADLAVLVGGIPAPVLAPSAVASIFTVDSTADTSDATPGDGVCDTGAAVCTLRAAVQEANASAGADTIQFALGAGTPSITVTAAMPAITDTVSILGDTGGATRVEVNGNAIAAAVIALAPGSGGSKVRALVINRAGTGQPGVKIESAGNTVEACYIGPDANGGGTVARNSGGGVLVTGAGATDNVIGGTTAGARNVISNNAQNGVLITANAAGTKVIGNYIGTTPAGDAGLSNSADGVNVAGGARNSVIGDATASPGTAPGNVISGNSSDGVEITGTGTTGNSVAGSLIGLRANGTTAQANTSNGVLIVSAAATNVVGGSTAAQRNVISANFSDGVEINGTGTNDNRVLGNFLGTDVTGTADLGNSGAGVYMWGGALRTGVGADAAAPGAAPGNLVSGNGGDGVKVQSSSTSDTTIAGNIIGLNLAGTASLKNDGQGVLIDAAPNTRIGGATAAARNVVSGHNLTTQNGIDIRSTGANNTSIQGNYIGTDITGTVAIPNYNGIRANITSGGAVTGTVVGGATATPGTAPGNLISGNGNNGLTFSGGSMGASTIAGNIVGLNATGTAVLKNSANGIEITSSASAATIGGTTAASRNVVSGNGASFNSGISITSSARNNIVQGNYVGTDITGTIAFGNGQHGISIRSGSQNNTIGGITATPGLPPGNVVSGNIAATGTSASAGINLDGSTTTGNTIQGNLVGTNAAGTASLSNRRAGIWVNQTGANTIGGSAAGAGNVIAGNNLTATSYGIEIVQASNLTIRGNSIGTDITGLTALANTGDGILVTDNAGFTAASNNVIGGSAAGEGNVIAGNGGAGVRVSGAFATSNTIAGNRIGVGADGATAVPNGTHGVHLQTGTATNTIGGTALLTPGACTGPCNAIGNNAGAGVRADGTGTRNAIRGNAIFRNGALGIDLGGAGVTANDVLDPDAGANNLLNYPVITGTSWDGVNTTVNGTVNTTANATGLSIELFSNPAADPSGFGQGRAWLATATGITTNASGDGTWQIVVPGQPTWLAATTVDSTGNTSEFSAAFNPVVDSDGDGVVDASDCAPFDASAYAPPAEVSGLVFAPNKTDFSWSSLAAQAGPGIRYDAMRGEVLELPVGGGASETCVGSGLSATTASEAGAPAAGGSFYVLVRGRNVCATGSYGTSSNGTPRVTNACP